MTRRSSTLLAPAAFLLLAILAAAPAFPFPPLDLPSGRYQARPGPVLVCGGIAGGCYTGLLEGSLDLDLVVSPIPTVKPDLHLTGSHLQLRIVDEDRIESFPPIETPPVSQLNGEVKADLLSFSSPFAPDNFHLELMETTFHSFLLSGLYFPGCCDQFAYSVRGVLFDWTGPANTQPAMHLAGHRFEVRVDWQDFDGGSGSGTPVRFDNNSGAFWFFSPDNPELLVKVIDACSPPFDRIWFFVAGLTNTGVTIHVRDREGGEKVYTNTLGDTFQPILDTDAFPCP